MVASRTDHAADDETVPGPLGVRSRRQQVLLLLIYGQELRVDFPLL